MFEMANNSFTPEYNLSSRKQFAYCVFCSQTHYIEIAFVFSFINNWIERILIENYAQQMQCT